MRNRRTPPARRRAAAVLVAASAALLLVSQATAAPADNLLPGHAPSSATPSSAAHVAGPPVVLTGSGRLAGTGSTRGESGGAPLVVAAAGDIACARKSRGSSCRQELTAATVESIDPDLVLALGDTQYETGDLKDYRNRGAYDDTWGRFKAKTHAVPGNHEYKTSRGAGYYSYFGAAGGPRGKGYHSFDRGGWHFVGLNSEVDISARSSQLAWLNEDLRKNAKPTVAFIHKPRWSSGNHGSYRELDAVWRVLAEDDHVQLVLSGDNHDYERLPRFDANGRRSRSGLLSFVVGTGGKNLKPFSEKAIPGEVRSNDSFGVLKLTLRADRFEWRFVPAAGGFTDSGSSRLR